LDQVTQKDKLELRLLCMKFKDEFGTPQGASPKLAR